MAQPESIKAYYATLSGQEKIRFLIGFTTYSGQVYLPEELENCRKELIRDYFSPKDENGNPDMRKMDKRLSAYVYEIAKQTAQLGKVMESTGENREEALSAESYMLQKTRNFMKDKVLKEGLIPEEMIDTVLKTLGKKAEGREAKQEAFLSVTDDAQKRLEQKLKKPEHATMRRYYEQGRQAASAEAAHSDHAIEQLGRQLETAGLRGSVRLANDAAELPCIMQSGFERLSAGGQNKTWWHRNNSEEFSRMMTTLKNYADALNGQDASAEYLDSAKQTLIQTGLKYIAGKEKVRSSQFGRERFDATMTLLASVMDRAEFQMIVDRINQKRGLTGKKNDPDYVTVDQYRRKASAMTRSMPVNEEEEMCMGTLESYYGPVSAKEELADLDIGGLTGVLGKPLTGREFTAVAYAAAMSPEAAMKGSPVPHMNPQDNALATRACFTTDLAVGKETGAYLGAVRYSREKAQSVLEAYRYGDKEPLGKLLGEALHEMAAQTRCAETLDDKWVYEGEQKARMLQMLTGDPALMEHAKKAGLTEEDIAITGSAVEAGRIRGRAAQAEEQLKSGREFTDEQRLSLYADILLDTYIRDRVQDNYFGAVAQSDEAEKDIREAEVRAGGQIYRDVYEANARRKHMETPPDLKALGTPKGPDAYRQAMKNAIRREGIEKLSLEKAQMKFGNFDFQKRTVAKEVSKALEPAKKAPGRMV